MANEKFGEVHIAQEYSDVIDPNLYADSTMQPYDTFNPHVLQRAGGRFIPRVTGGGAEDPKNTVGAYDYTDASDELIQIVANNFHRPAVRIYNKQIESVSYDIKEENVANLIKGTIRPSFNGEALACLVHEGTALTADAATVLTKDNIGDYLLTLRKKLRDAGAEGDRLIVSTAIYNVIRQAAPNEFVEDVKNDMTATGKVGYWKGWKIKESNVFTFRGTAKYYDYSGTLQTVDLTKVDLIAYDWEKFYIDVLPNNLDVVDGRPTFPGVAVVSDFAFGYRVANPKCVLVKLNSAEE